MISKREDPEALIEEAAKAMYFEDCGVAALEDDAEPFREMARVALGVFEQAHTPTENSGPIPLYGMLDVWMALYGTSHPEFDEFYAEHGYAETWARILAAVRERRPVQGEPTAEPVGISDQLEPTDAQVLAALNAYYGGTYPVSDAFKESMTPNMRAALRAAFQTGENRVS